MMQTQQADQGLFGQEQLGDKREPSDFALKLGAIIDLVDGTTDYEFGNQGMYETLDMVILASNFDKVMKAFGAVNLSPVLSVILSEDQVTAFITHPRLNNLAEWINTGDSPLGMVATLVSKPQLQHWGSGLGYAHYQHPRGYGMNPGIYAQPGSPRHQAYGSRQMGFLEGLQQRDTFAAKSTESPSGAESEQS